MRADPAPDWLSAGEALAVILGSVTPLGAETRPLLEARGWVLARDVTAEVDLPPWRGSAMDGFAVRAGDVRGATAAEPVVLRIVDDIPAGSFPAVPLGAGEAVRVMTGAPVPVGAEGVVRVEHTDGGRDIGTPEGRVTIHDDADAARNIRPAGDDVRRGEVPLRAGSVVSPARIAMAAALGCARLTVVRRPLVAVLASGDELVPVEAFAEVRAGRRIVSSNSYALAAQLAEIGCAVRMLGIARDTPESLRAHLERARGCDALVTSAGVSVGEHDHVRPVLAELGTEIAFWRVRARPGSALAFGRVDGLGGIPWFGLPGNPVSTAVCFDLFARPALLRMAGHQRIFPAVREATLADDYAATGTATHFARVCFAEDGTSVRLTRSQSSGATSALAEADGLAVIPPGPATPAGSRVRVLTPGGAPSELHPPF